MAADINLCEIMSDCTTPTYIIRLPPTMTVTRRMLRLQFCHVICCLLALIHGVNSDIRPFYLNLEPASGYIHYVDGFLLAPGYIDLGELRFYTLGGDYNDDDLAISEDEDDDDDFEGGEEGGDDNNPRRLDDFSMQGSEVDIAVFHLPASCATSRLGCDWTELGIGSRADDDSLRYCCSNDAIDLGLCQGTQFGRLLVTDKFEGKHRVVNIPATGIFDSNLKYGKFEQKEGNGKYVVVFANCNDDGRPVAVEGRTIWRSKDGYLPGDLFGLMYFLAFLFFVYFGMMVWYGVTMKMFEDANIPIQAWIFGTICMGCLELFFRTGDLFVWNEEGVRFWVAFYVGVIVGVLKRGVSRCLIVMVSNGWGVVKDDLGATMKKIIALGGLYIAVSLVRDIMKVVADVEVRKISEEEETELLDVVSILSIVILVIDVIFYLWIIDSLNASMEYLENMSQTSKLMRYLRLRCVLIFSILFAVILAVFGMVDSYDEGVIDQEQEWVLAAAMELNYIFVLMGVAILWRPQENAKEYAYVMELPALSADDDGVSEMELSGTVPSAADDDDDVVVFK